MELVANIWPVVDEASSLIQRFAARAYALDASEIEIAATLKCLAKSDFMIARQFPVSEECVVITEHGTLKGIVTVDFFNQNAAGLIEKALLALESNKPPLQGIGFDSKLTPYYKQVDVKFPANPYIVTTFLVEDRSGNLRVYSKS